MRRVVATQGYSLVELLMALAIAGVIGGAVLGVYTVSQDTYIRASSLEAAQDGARAGLDRMANELRLIGSHWVGASCALADCNAITTATATRLTFRANVDNSSVINGVEATAGSQASGTSVPLSLSTSNTANAFKTYSNAALNDYIYIANGGTREVKQIQSIGGNTLTLASALGSTYPAGSIVRDVKTITYTRNANATSTCPALTCLTRTQGGDSADPIVDNVTGLTFTYFQSDGVTRTTDPAMIREIQIDLTVCQMIRGACQNGSTRYMTTRVKPRSLP